MYGNPNIITEIKSKRMSCMGYRPIIRMDEGITLRKLFINLVEDEKWEDRDRDGWKMICEGWITYKKIETNDIGNEGMERHQ